MKRTGILVSALLASTAPAVAWAQEATSSESNVKDQAMPPRILRDADRTVEAHEPTPAVDGGEQPDDPNADAPTPEEMIFRDMEGNPLPDNVQEQLREHFRNNPEARAMMTRREPESEEEIVVTGDRPRGSVIGDIPAERSFSQNDIRAYGASTIEELLDALGPQVASNRGRGDNTPITLLNGRRVSDFSEIARIPTEAIERTDVFPEELALQYGFRADQKVVNIVTFERFNSQFGQVAGLRSTEGGWASGTIDADHFQISGDTRFSITARHSRSGALLESERDIVQPVETPERGAFRTLIPRSERVELGGLVGRPFGQEMSGTLTARFERSSSESLLGPDPAATRGALRRDTGSTTLRVGAAVNGSVDRWLWNVSGNFLRVGTYLKTDGTRSGASRDLADSLASNLDAGVLLNGPLVELPAGPLSASIRGSIQKRDFDASSLFGGARQDTDLQRRTARVQFSLDAPLLEEISSIGRASVNANLALESLSDTRDLRTFSYGLVWSPIDAIGIVASATREEGAPSLQQLGGPSLVTPGVRIFDFARGEVVDVTRISGGNRALVPDDRDVFRFGLNARPIARTDFTISVDYVATRIDDPIADFPIVLPEIEADFPDRFAREADGTLVRIDGRPANFVRSDQQQLRWGLNFTRPLGPVPQSIGAGTGRTFADAEEARRAFPDAVIVTAEPGSALARQGENLRSRAFVSLYHNWYLKDEIVLRDGLPPLDLLGGDALDFAGGRRRHQVELTGGVFRRGLGARVNAIWRSGTDIVGVANVADGNVGNLRFDSLATVNLNLFANLQEQFGDSETPGWLQGMRATIGVNNVFNARKRVQNADGQIPLAYQPAYLDSLGRIVTISLRKVF